MHNIVIISLKMAIESIIPEKAIISAIMEVINSPTELQVMRRRRER